MLLDNEVNLLPTLDELLSIHDAEFIHAAYRALLGREPDAEGVRYYLNRLRSGISKIEVLSQLRRSKEAQEKLAPIAGLDVTIARYRRSRHPLVRFLRGLTLQGRAHEETRRQLLAIENRLYGHEVQLKRGLSGIHIALADVRRQLSVPSADVSNVAGIQPDHGKAGNQLQAPHRTTQPNIANGASRDSAAHRATSAPQMRPAGTPARGIRQDQYRRLIEDSGLFDPVFYLSSYTVESAFRSDPVSHYIQHGEAAGWQPNPDFWPDAYLKNNPDVATSGTSPFQHYLQIGRFEGRRTRPLPPVEGGYDKTPMPAMRGIRFQRPARLAVCLHIYYYELWDELDRVLTRLQQPFDLFISIVDRGAPLEQLQKDIARARPEARVFVFPNHGRDVLSFVAMAAAGLFDPYDAVCKIHTKKSPHREDGDRWRDHLINGVIPATRADELVDAFLADPTVGILVADGQIFEGAKWWGALNCDRVPQLLHRVEIRMSMDELVFPAGSIFWMKRPLINLVRGMQLSASDFEQEDSQVDGTTAHAFERAVGFLARSAQLAMLQTTEVLSKSVATVQHATRSTPKPFVSCFYLPQFHPTPENDAWWGPGYTEWSAVTSARPQFDGHRQPALPADLGYYDLRRPEVIGQQYALARAHGIDAFCMYYYSFDNQRRLLEEPLDNLLKRPDIDVGFYLCWANESWTRNWDGLSGTTLMPQSYLRGCERQIAESTAQYFRDPRYYRDDAGAPRFVIYRIHDIPDVRGFVGRLREEWKSLGFDKVKLGAVLFHLDKDVDDETAALFDFFIEMPPHGLVGATDYLVGGESDEATFPRNGDFRGLIYSYERLIENSVARSFPKSIANRIVRGIMPSWDNTARRDCHAHICYGANPATFSSWLRRLLDTGLPAGELMINAWNEWGEKAVMEPTQQFGDGYLKALKNVLEANCPDSATRSVQSPTARRGIEQDGQPPTSNSTRRVQH